MERDEDGQRIYARDEFTCEDCGRSCRSAQEDGNQRVCLRCEARFMAEIDRRIEEGE